MCGRYAASRDAAELVEVLDVQEDRTQEPVRTLAPREGGPGVVPDYNVAPTKLAPVVLTRRPRGEPEGDPVRQLRMLTWGLVPAWAKDVSVGMRMINARSETLLDKPAYARAAASRRCLVPADGYYEWQRSPVATDAKGRPRKQPFYVHRTDGDPVVMAGLYEFWRDRTLADDDPAAWLVSYCVITRPAEGGMAHVHERMPLVLDRQDWAGWLDPGTTDPDRVRAYLELDRSGALEAHAVGTAVNAVRNNGPHLLDPAPPEELVGVVDPSTGEVVGG